MVKKTTNMCENYALFGWAIVIGGILYGLPQFGVTLNVGVPLFPTWVILIGFYMLYKAYL